MRVTAGMLLLFFWSTTSPGIGWVPAVLATVQQDIEHAQDLYDFAEFQQAMDLATSLISAGQLSETQEREAYVIRARSAAGLGLTAQAQEDFCRVHKLDQTWKPDPVMFPKGEVDLFNAALLDCQEDVIVPAEEEAAESKPFYMKPVAWAAAAGVLVLALVLVGGDDDEPTPQDDTPLADFPDPPTN